MRQSDQQQIEPQPLPPAGDTPGRQPDWLANTLMSAGVAILVIVVLGRLRRKTARHARQPVLPPDDRLAAIRAADQIRELTAVLDTRIGTLDILIQQADERIARLEAAERGVPGHVHGPVRDAHLRDNHTTDNRPDFNRPDSQKQEIYRLADEGLGAGEIAARLGQHAGKVELILALRRV
jgi:hypothetical protein